MITQVRRQGVLALVLAVLLMLSTGLTAQAAESDKTYTVTANLYCPGELNTQLPGVTAYLTNGNNPLGIGGYEAAAEALAGVAGAAIARVAVGTSGTEPTEGDTALTDAVSVAIQSVEYPAAGTVRFNFSIGYDVAVGKTIREFGLLTADGRLFSRKVREGIEKTEAMSIVGRWDIII